MEGTPPELRLSKMSRVEIRPGGAKAFCLLVFLIIIIENNNSNNANKGEGFTTWFYILEVTYFSSKKHSGILHGERVFSPPKSVVSW